MKNTHSYLILGALLAFPVACATASEDVPPGGTGSDTSVDRGTGGMGTGGGSVIGTGASTSVGTGGGSSTGGAAGSGGAAATGGATGTGGATTACTPGDEVDCADVNTAGNLYGKAKCSLAGTGYDQSTCKFCEGTISCADGENPDSTKSKGEASCNGAGTAWLWGECSACTVGVDTRPCSEVDPLLPYGGPAVCQAGGSYSTADCTECDGSAAVKETKPCTSLGDPKYTGGMAVCQGDGTFDDSTCEYCGNDVRETGEQCDGDVDAASQALTCEDIDPPYPGDTDSIVECKNNCKFETNVCSICEPGITKCLGEGANSSNCSGPSQCNDAQCGTGESCTMQCSGNNSVCTGMSCNAGATCLVNNTGDLATVNFDCKDDATKCDVLCGRSSPCNITCGANTLCSNTALDSTKLTMSCGAGATCNAVCGRSQDCNLTCSATSKCNVDASQDRSVVKGALVCGSGTCNYNLAGNSTHTATLDCKAGATCNITIANGSSLTGAVTCNGTCSCPTKKPSSCTGPGCGTCL